jgi:hypothetical protein
MLPMFSQLSNAHLEVVAIATAHGQVQALAAGMMEAAASNAAAAVVLPLPHHLRHPLLLALLDHFAHLQMILLLLMETQALQIEAGPSMLEVQSQPRLASTSTVEASNTMLTSLEQSLELMPTFTQSPLQTWLEVSLRADTAMPKSTAAIGALKLTGSKPTETAVVPPHYTWSQVLETKLAPHGVVRISTNTTVELNSI